MLYTALFLATLASQVTAQLRACNADNCARAVTGTAGTRPVFSKLADCSSFLLATVTPAAVTSTVTVQAAVTVTTTVSNVVDTTTGGAGGATGTGGVGTGAPGTGTAGTGATETDAEGTGATGTGPAVTATTAPTDTGAAGTGATGTSISGTSIAGEEDGTGATGTITPSAGPTPTATAGEGEEDGTATGRADPSLTATTTLAIAKRAAAHQELALSPPALAKRQVTVPTGIPAYASACGGPVRYSSACSCFGVTAATTTVAAPVVTVTTTATVTTVVTVAVPVCANHPYVFTGGYLNSPAGGSYVFNTSFFGITDPTLCCGQCWSTPGCLYNQIATIDNADGTTSDGCRLIIQSGASAATGVSAQCPLGIYEVVLSAGDYYGLGPCETVVGTT